MLSLLTHAARAGRYWDFVLSQPSIRLETSPPIAEIILNKPTKRNALSVDMWREIPVLVERAVADPEVKVILIHGGDAGAFAAGADISEFATIYATPEAAAASGGTIAAALDSVEACEKPVIAAIQGACVGGGVSLAMAADFRIAEEGAKFGITPGKLGLVYPAGDTRRLLTAIGPGAAKDLLFTGRIFEANEAKAMGLIDRLAEHGSALEAARTMAVQISAISQWSVRATKTMIAGLQSGWDDRDPKATALFLDGFSNEDFQDGYRAFLEKRSAKFTFK
jgi:enoyl-CoA hydratase/carnithine racemase